jgi:dynein heavy chain
MLEIENIPEEAIKIFDQNNQYRSFITSLDYTVDSYNKILRLASVEERPLIQNEIDLIDAQLENGEKNLKWKSPNINEYISGNQNGVSDLEKRLQKSKLNLERIKKLMNTWTNNPLFKRCDFYATKSTLLQLDDKPLRLETRYKEISDTGLQIHQIVEVKNILIILIQLTIKFYS